MICAGNPRLWVNLCRAIGRPELADDPRFSTNEDRLRHRALLVTELEATLKTMTVQEVIDRLGEHHVPCGRVRSVADALEDPQLLAREMVVEMPHDDLGAVTVIGNPIKLSRTPASYRLAPPQLGEHTAEVLRTLAYTDADVERIVAATRSQGHPGAPVVS
jgi:crotonobetainyl-CoA:carnitine CoA-transferase CaiB-like acyl-CoA transferase